MPLTKTGFTSKIKNFITKEKKIEVVNFVYDKIGGDKIITQDVIKKFMNDDEVKQKNITIGLSEGNNDSGNITIKINDTKIFKFDSWGGPDFNEKVKNEIIAEIEREETNGGKRRKSRKTRKQRKTKRRKSIKKHRKPRNKRA